MMAERIAYHTGQPVERIEADSDRDRWFTAAEAKEYGFIDQVIERAADVTEPTAASNAGCHTRSVPVRRRAPDR